MGPLGSATRAPNANTLADPFTVTNLNDHGIGSLRWVVSYADSGQTIRFDPALAGQTNVLDSVITMYLEAITIEGPNERGLTICRGGKTRVLETWGAGPHVLRNLARPPAPPPEGERAEPPGVGSRLFVPATGPAENRRRPAPHAVISSH